MIFAWVSLFVFFSTPSTAGFGTFCDRTYALFGISKKKPPIVEVKATPAPEKKPLVAESKPIGAEPVVPAIDPGELVQDRLEKIDTNLGKAFDQIHRIQPNLVNGRAKPTWDDIEILDSSLQLIRTGKANAIKSGKSAELNALLPELVEYAKTNEIFQKIAAAGDLKGAKGNSYQPTEYELKRLYQYKLWELNKELPPPLKIRGARIPFDQRRNSLVAEARALIKAQEEKYASLYPSTGFPNREALIAAIKKQSPEAEAVLAMLEKEEVEFVMRRPEGGRWWIPKVGFQNQRVSGSSKGTLSTEKRDTAEAFLTFGKKSEYEKLDNDLKPKYGYLRPKPEQTLSSYRYMASGYGEDIYVLKKDNVRDRSTWTAGDSLGRGVKREEGDAPQIWHDAFTPWSSRELLVPVVMPKNIKEDKYFKIRRPKFNEASPLKPFPESLPSSAYPEMQYWGPVTLDDVEAFEFSGNPPSGEFLDELLKRNIKIRDARGDEPVDWHPLGRSEK